MRVNGYEPYREREKAAREMTVTFERPRFDIDASVREVYNVLRDIGALIA